jgi:hypothetical protein
LLLAKGRVTTLTRLAKVRRVGVHPATGDQIGFREGSGRQPAPQGVGPGGGSTKERLRGPAAGAPLGGRRKRRAGRRGVPPKRGHEQDAPFFNARQGAGRSWRLAHRSAREARGELGRRSTVMHGVL